MGITHSKRRYTMTRALFLTGTDTGVGKTLLGRLLLAYARRQGLAAFPYKPFESGCPEAPNGMPLPQDTLALLRAAGHDPKTHLSEANTYAFLPPLAPAIAAHLAGMQAAPDSVVAHYLSLRDRYDLVTVEGAGGLLVPLAADFLVADLCERLCAPLLIVARASLGTINHTLLTLNEARRRCLTVAGVVLSATSPNPGPDFPYNAGAIERLGDTRVFGTLPHLPNADTTDTDTLLATALGHVDLEAILRAAT